MVKEERKLGIDIVGDVPWGTHLCLFYQSKEDLIDILVPYFKAGLENNEFCMWVTSEPLEVEDAKVSLKKVVKDLDNYIERGQIEILDYTQWYIKSGRQLELDKVLQGWVEKEKQALKRGFDGIRVTGNTYWLEKSDWSKFADYEAVVNKAIGKYRMIAICSYCLDKCGASEVIDVVNSHQFALIKREGKWVVIESAERKRAEEELRKEKLFTENALNNLLDNFSVLDLEGRFIRWNKRVNEVTGYSDKEISAMKITDLFREEDTKRLFAGMEKMVRGEQARDEVTLVTRNGRHIPYELFGSLIKDSDGKLVGISGIGRDITESKRAEEELRKEKNFSANVIATVPDSLLVLDKNLRIKSANRSFYEKFQTEPEEVIGSGIADILEDKGRKLSAALTKLFGTEDMLENFELHYQSDKLGEWIFNITARGMLIAEEEEEEELVVLEDITERKRAEEALRKAHDELERRVKERTLELVKANEQLKQEITEREHTEEERERFLKELKAKSTELEKAMEHMVDLEEMTRMKTEFLSITSHELRTPLTPMKAQLQMLREGYVGKLNKKQENSIEVILRNLTRLENLIGDILGISRIEAGRIKLSFNSMNINDAVKEAIKMQEAFAKEKNIGLSAKLAEMPNIIGDAERLGQAISNLLNNAIKFSEKTGKVTIETKRLGKNVQFSITDYGIGISKADQKELFKPFSQIDSSMGREHDGTGLGLAIAKGIIQAHNGKVWSESELGKGSTFCFVIPTKQKITEKEASYIG